MTDETKAGEQSERLHMRISPEELTAIDDWRFKNRIASRSDAVRRLVRIGLVHEELRNVMRSRMMDLLQDALVLGDESLREAPRDEDELNEFREVASSVVTKSSLLYETLLELTIRVTNLSDGDEDLARALDWEERVRDFLEGKSLFDSIRRSPEARMAIAKAATKGEVG